MNNIPVPDKRHLSLQQNVLSVVEAEEASKTTARDATIDMAKALCIILMVIGHGCCGEYMFRFIYWFHMPCFFFITGWLLKDKYINNPKQGIINKFKGIFVPCIKWSIIFILLHNLFVPLHIYDSYISFSDSVKKIFHVLTFGSANEPLIGPYWFLTTLLFASSYSIIYLNVLSRFNRLNIKWIVAGILIFLGLTFLFDARSITLHPLCFQTAFYATAFTICGYLMHKLYIEDKFKIYNGYILLLAIPMILAYVMPPHYMNTAESYQIVYYFIVAFLSIIGIYACAKYLSGIRAFNFLNTVGANTLNILALHLLSLKIVFAIYLIAVGEGLGELYDMEYRHIEDFPLWIFSAIAGVTIPLAVTFAWRSLRNVLFNSRV